MLGQLQIAPGRWNRVEESRLCGRTLLRASIDPEGFLGEARMRHTMRKLHRAGVIRTLLPREWDCPSWLESTGLRTVDPGPFLRAQSPELTLEVLRRQDFSPEQATVALCGRRADREMAQAACVLCGRVRHLVIDAPEGGEKLAHWLRWEFGIPILPVREPAQLAVRFQKQTKERDREPVLELYGRRPDLYGITLTMPDLPEEQRSDLDLLSVLWEWGELKKGSLKFT